MSGNPNFVNVAYGFNRTYLILQNQTLQNHKKNHRNHKITLLSKSQPNMPQKLIKSQLN